MRGQFYEHFSTVLLTVPTCDRSLVHEAINEFYRAVMAQAESFRERPDGGTTSRRQSFDGQKDLEADAVLMPFDRAASSLKCRELANAITELGKAAGILQLKSVRSARAEKRINVLSAGNHERHLTLVSYHDVIHTFNGGSKGSFSSFA